MAKKDSFENCRIIPSTRKPSARIVNAEPSEQDWPWVVRVLRVQTSKDKRWKNDQGCTGTLITLEYVFVLGGENMTIFIIL